ncbi:hypothetical protein Hanom_Chr05g00442521 [Helianthus anomalus]
MLKSKTCHISFNPLDYILSNSRLHFFSTCERNQSQTPSPLTSPSPYEHR